MYNLLIHSSPWSVGNGTARITTDRLFEHTNSELAARFKDGNLILRDELRQLPCLFMKEGRDNGHAYVGTITELGCSGTSVNFSYSFDLSVRPILNRVISANMSRFGISNDFEFNRTHWAVKDIDLFRTLLPLSQSPTRQSPKVFSIPENEAIDRNLVSVMMPFDEGFDSVYEAIRDAAADIGFGCLKADEFWEHHKVIQDIVTLIDKSFVVVCDCSGRNPNVFYEIGIAHTLGRQVVLITQTEADVPFDLRHLRYIKYLNNNEGRRTLKSDIIGRLRYLRSNP